MNDKPKEDILSQDADRIKAGKARNDNSNPQQGTGGPRQVSLSPGAVDQTIEEKQGTPAKAFPYSRPSLKIPPTRKDDRKLFVGGLPEHVTNEEFRLFFEQFGEVMDSIVLVDRHTNRSRGFGFVTFEDAGPAKKLLSMDHPEGSNLENPTSGFLEMQGKTIEVKCAQPKESTRRSGSRGMNRFNQASAVYPPTGHLVQAVPVVDPQVMPSFPGDFAYGPPAYYPPPGGTPVFAGYVAPMYYMPGQPGAPMLPTGASPPFAAPSPMVEAYPPAFFVPEHQFTPGMMTYTNQAVVSPENAFVHSASDTYHQDAAAPMNSC